MIILTDKKDIEIILISEKKVKFFFNNYIDLFNSIKRNFKKTNYCINLKQINFKHISAYNANVIVSYFMINGGNCLIKNAKIVSINKKEKSIEFVFDGYSELDNFQHRKIKIKNII